MRTERGTNLAYISPALNVMMAAARKAGRHLVRDLGELENLQVSMKGPADFVTNADKRTERILIDPIDGTSNFMHGVPHFAISLALEREGQLASALVYNPATDEMFVAEKGHGAFLNDKRLRVASRKTLNTALVATGIPFLGHGDFAKFDAELNAIMPNVSGIRRFG